MYSRSSRSIHFGYGHFRNNSSNQTNNFKKSRVPSQGRSAPNPSASRLNVFKNKRKKKRVGSSGLVYKKGKSTSRQGINKSSSSSSISKRASTPQGSIRIEKNGRKITLSFKNYEVIGNGSFGIVFLCKITETNAPVAVKKVFQDQRFKNRELQIMKTLSHPNIVKMIHFFYSKQFNEEKDREDIYLNLIMEYLPDTVYGLCKTALHNRSFVPWQYIKIFSYQLLRGINYMHSMGICHRDIKPQNLLVDQLSGKLKICDFGSAKTIVSGEPNVSYICSRYYRAPELIFGETHYSTAVDIWSVGCVICEIISGRPIFPGENTVDQIVKIIKVLGTPSNEEISAFNRKKKKIKFPKVEKRSWRSCLRRKDFDGNEDVFDLIEKLLQYDPSKRIKPIDALAHPFFDELRSKKSHYTKVDLFNFTNDELRMSNDINIKVKLVPEWEST